MMVVNVKTTGITMVALIIPYKMQMKVESVLFTLLQSVA